jgi:hypothetical protein
MKRVINRLALPFLIACIGVFGYISELRAQEPDSNCLNCGSVWNCMIGTTNQTGWSQCVIIASTCKVSGSFGPCE